MTEEVLLPTPSCTVQSMRFAVQSIWQRLQKRPRLYSCSGTVWQASSGKPCRQSVTESRQEPFNLNTRRTAQLWPQTMAHLSVSSASAFLPQHMRRGSAVSKRLSRSSTYSEGCSGIVHFQYLTGTSASQAKDQGTRWQDLEAISVYVPCVATSFAEPADHHRITTSTRVAVDFKISPSVLFLQIDSDSLYNPLKSKFCHY